MNQPRSAAIRRSPRDHRSAALRKRAQFRLLNLAISGLILLAAHGAVFHFITRHLG